MSEKSPVIVDLRFHPDQVRAALKTAFADRETINLADPDNDGRDLSGIDYAVLWKPRDDLFSRARDLKVLFSGGAGVDSVLSLPGLPYLPLVRFVDHTLTTRMSEWIVMQCLMHLRQHQAYDKQKRLAIWNPLSQPEASELTVGIMGLGVLGSDAALKLRMIGFKVCGWSRTRKELEGIETFAEADLDRFLSRCDILVGLLPLTNETTGIFNRDLFRKLKHGGALGAPVFINAGRGASQTEDDLIEALKDGTLKAASLDVFETEPLPKASAFWTMDNVFLTPHVAADSDAGALFRHVERQIARYEAGEPLEYLVDRSRLY
jgi:glyoxylate/hydroxypyruvate reductase A